MTVSIPNEMLSDDRTEHLKDVLCVFVGCVLGGAGLVALVVLSAVLLTAWAESCRDFHDAYTGYKNVYWVGLKRHEVTVGWDLKNSRTQNAPWVSHTFWALDAALLVLPTLAYCLYPATVLGVHYTAKGLSRLPPAPPAPPTAITIPYTGVPAAFQEKEDDAHQADGAQVHGGESAA